MLSSFLGVLPILTPPLCALTLSCDQSLIPLLCEYVFYCLFFAVSLLGWSVTSFILIFLGG
jgi:hypothetical protein